MKKTQRYFALIMILSLTLMLLTACNLSGLSDALKTDIGKCEITLSSSTYEYTGAEIRPEISIAFVNKVLESGTDYSAEYFDNVEIGNGRVVVTGMGNFKGQATKEFAIVEKVAGGDGDISSGDVGAEDEFITYKFSAVGAEVVSGQLIQRVKSAEEIVAPTVEKFGYEFLYWTYGGEEVDFDDLDALPQQGATFTARFSAITYSIEYVLNGGENNPLNKSEYTVETTFELQDATRSDKQFAGWYRDGNFDDRFTSLSGLAEDIVLYAKYVDFDYKQLSYVTPSDVESMPYEMIYPGTTLTRPARVLSDDGSQELVWYIDEDMTIRHNVRKMPNEDLTLYARWEDKLYAGFLDRGWYKLADIKSIDSYQDLLAYVEFIFYYNITQESPKKVTYVSGETKMMEELTKALGESTFPRMIGSRYKCSSDNTCSVWMSSSVSGQATLSATEKEDYYLQIGHVFNNYTSNRQSNFDDFAIKYVEDTYECTTSDQLFYVLSHGYRPLPASGSPAYRIYNKFKEIMRCVCDDRMTDLQKARAIFDWLVINVYYDNNVAFTTLPQASYKYEAFYMEGVLNGAAVCDGLSKAYSVMCAIEGIDCVRVTGKLKDAEANDAGHAWNKVQIMGEWFLSDSTWGNRVIGVQSSGGDVGYYEYVNGKYFLFTDGERANVDNYNSDQYSQYVADSQFNYYDNFKMQLEVTEKNSWGMPTGKHTYTFDLCIDGDDAQGYDAVDEMSYVFEYIDKNMSDLSGMSFCIMLGEEMPISNIEEALNAYIKRVGSANAKIKRFSLIRDADDAVDEENKIYKAGAIITIVLSLPQANLNSASQNAA